MTFAELWNKVEAARKRYDFGSFSVDATAWQHHCRDDQSLKCEVDWTIWINDWSRAFRSHSAVSVWHDFALHLATLPRPELAAINPEALEATT